MAFASLAIAPVRSATISTTAPASCSIVCAMRSTVSRLMRADLRSNSARSQEAKARCARIARSMAVTWWNSRAAGRLMSAAMSP